MGVCSIYEGNAILEEDSSRSHDKRGDDWEVRRGMRSCSVLILQTVSSFILESIELEYAWAMLSA
jgi:hypothetical protein